MIKAPNRHFVATIYVVSKIDKVKKVLFIHHKKMNTWLPPGGHIECIHQEYELPHLAALREVYEETGLKVEFAGSREKERQKYSIKNIKSPIVLPCPDHMMLEHIGVNHEHIDFLYFGKVKSNSKVKINPNESNSYKWFDSKELDAELKKKKLWKHIHFFAHKALNDVFA